MKALNNYIPEFGNCEGITLKSSLLVIPAALLGISLVINSCDSIQTVGLHESLEVIPAVSLIEEARNSTITVNKGTESYFQLEIANIMPNEHIQTGLAKGWCMVWNKPIASDNAVHDGIRLYSSYGDNSLKPVNYLLNIRESLMADDQALTYREIQVAIWSLLHYPEFDLNKIRVDQLPSDMVSNGRFNFDRKKVEQIVKLVRNNIDSFRYNRASAYAVVAETPSDTQTIIIEVSKPVWAYGQYSFRSQALREALGITGRGKGQWGWIFEFDANFSSASTELIAGGGNDDGTKAADEVGTIIGSLDISKNGSRLNITFNAFSDYLLGDFHLWAGCSLDDFPIADNNGNVAPGLFPYSFNDDKKNSHIFTVNTTELNCGGNIFISAHAGRLFKIAEVRIPDEVEPVFEIVDLSPTGLPGAVDINDHGHIVGGQLYWNSDTGILINMGIHAIAMNNHGQVISSGQYWDKNVGIIAIDTLDFSGITRSWSRAYDINDDGYVVGEAEYFFGPVDDDDYEFWSMVWTLENGIIDHFGFFSTAHSINNINQITGVSHVEAFPHEIYVTDHFGSGFRDIGEFEGYEWGSPDAINEKGQLVGSIRVLQSDGNNLLALNRGKNQIKGRSKMNKLLRITNTAGIYDYGHVVEMLRNSTLESEIMRFGGGRRSFSMIDSYNEDLLFLWDQEEQKQILAKAQSSTYQSEAFVWDEQSGIISLGTLGGTWSRAWDINDHGQVVGYSDIGGDEYRAFYWDEEFGIIELPTFGGNSYARAINNKGQIVGYSYDDTGNFYPVQWNVTFE